MFRFLRSELPPRLNRASQNPVIYEDGASSFEFGNKDSEYFLRNKHPPWSTENPSIMVPPLHYHIDQAESFRIMHGEGHIFRNSTNKPWVTLSASDPHGLKTAVIPRLDYHTIHNASATEPMIMDVHLSPEDYVSEERFFRNFFGYLDDCKRAGQQPSLFQLMVFLKASDTPLGLGNPAGWLGHLWSRVYYETTSWWGYWILGYQPSYAEYYTENTSKGK